MQARAQKGRRNPRSGVTLIEMLVALAIFSLVGIAGFALLSQSLKSRGVAEVRLQRLSDIERAIFVIKQDFLGAAWVEANTLQGSGIRRFVVRPSALVYFLQNDTLYRGDENSSNTQPLLTGVVALEVRTVPNGLSVAEMSAEDTKAEMDVNKGFQVTLEIDGVGRVEVVSPSVSLVPPEEEITFQ